MTNPTEAAKQRACDLANANTYCVKEYRPADVLPHNPCLRALAQHIQAVSDAVKAWDSVDLRGWTYTGEAFRRLQSFSLPDPEPDPLVEAIKAANNPDYDPTSAEDYAEALRHHLAKSGHTITRTEER